MSLMSFFYLMFVCVKIVRLSIISYLFVLFIYIFFYYYYLYLFVFVGQAQGPIHIPIPESKFLLWAQRAQIVSICRWPEWHSPNIWPNFRLQAMFWFTKGWLLVFVFSLFFFFMHVSFLSIYLCMASPTSPLAKLATSDKLPSIPQRRSSTCHDSLRLQLSCTRRLPANPHGFPSHIRLSRLPTWMKDQLLAFAPATAPVAS